MKLVTGQEMAAIDRRAMEEYGIPGIVLMENAGLKVVEAAFAMLGDQGRRVTILCGPGNNGGDGMVVARHLLNAGLQVFTFLIGDPERLSGDALTNYIVLSRMGATPRPVKEEEDLDNAVYYILTSDLIIDAIYGTGFKGALTGIAGKLVSLINRSKRPVLAIDVPSGLNASTGEVEGDAVRADWTVTMALPKIGLVVGEGPAFVGKLTVADISMPRKLLEDEQYEKNLVTEDMVRANLGLRPRDSHKGDYGHVLVIGGSRGMIGAPVMAGLAALRGGAGLVTIGVPFSIQPQVASKVTEIMTLPLPETEDSTLALDAFPEIMDFLPKARVAVVGCGMGTGKEGRELVAELISGSPVPLVLDADALNLLQGHTSLLTRAVSPLVLTPHPGEMARLTGLGVSEIQRERIAIAQRFAQEWGVTLVLKGFRTVTATREGRVYLNLTGNPGMATAGSGDVLAGLIGAFISQGLTPEAAAFSGVYVHGLSGDLAAEEKGERSLTALDLVEAMPAVFKEWEKKTKLDALFCRQ